jgi:CO dehydrogenase maturation factor
LQKSVISGIVFFMIIGFLGKGGSGKSTISTQFVEFLLQKNKKVLAIDADHNMDITYNLGITKEIPYLGDALLDIKKFSGLSPGDDYRKALEIHDQEIFSLEPQDDFTKKYTTLIKNNLHVMSAGPQTQDILTDKSCSHVLFTPLKVYLPLLKINQNEWVIIDEKAGADGVSTGIPTGFDIACIITEPTTHGIKTANQIGELLDYFEVPYEFIINKVQDPSQQLPITLNKKPIAVVPLFSEKENSETYFNTLYLYLENHKSNFIGKRLIRSKKKFQQ